MTESENKDMIVKGRITMITLESIAKADYTPRYDGCGNIAVAVLDMDGVRIPLCAECLKDLRYEMDRFAGMVFCKDCRHFVSNKYGYAYDGSCRKRAEEAEIAVTEDNRGYVCPTGFMDTCREAVRKEANEHD